MSRSLRTMIAALGVLVSAASPASAFADRHHALNLECATTPTTLFFSGTYDNVVVPAGQNCELSDSTVYGDVTVKTGGSITFENSGTVGGHLLLGRQAGASEGSGWVISGPALANGAADLTVLGAVHGIFVNDTGTLGVQSATVDGNIVSARGDLGGAIVSSVITGDLIINGTATNPGSSGGADWLIAGPQIDGDPQEIGGNVILTGNQSQIYLFDNHIRRDVICEGNNPAPLTSFAGMTNTVDGWSLGQCSTTTRPATPATEAPYARGQLDTSPNR